MNRTIFITVLTVTILFSPVFQKSFSKAMVRLTGTVVGNNKS